MRAKALLPILLVVFSVIYAAHFMGQEPEYVQTPPVNYEIYYKVVGDQIYMVNLSSGEEMPIHLFGVNWFGFETQDHVVHGL